MSFIDEYKKKLTTAEEAVKCINHLIISCYFYSLTASIW